MDDQRLERALRGGPPFTTHYSAPALPLDRAPTGAIARVRPMVLLLAAVALLLVALTTALIVGALRSSALAFTCADVADAMTRDVDGWTVDSSPVPATAVTAGMLVAIHPERGIALLDSMTGEPCSPLTLTAGRPLADTQLIQWAPSGDALAMLAGPENGMPSSLVVISEAGVMESQLEPARSTFVGHRTGIPSLS